MENDKQNKRKTGSEGEDIACEFLSNLGYKIIRRNYQYGHGEIDVIAKDGEEFVFVEVKFRKSLEYGTPETAVTKSKQRQLRKIAEAYLYENKIENTPCRMDVVAILQFPGQKPEINHYINAF
jgi:putative endonuclease